MIQNHNIHYPYITNICTNRIYHFALLTFHPTENAKVDSHPKKKNKLMPPYY
jgi:hypothetical protein